MATVSRSGRHAGPPPHPALRSISKDTETELKVPARARAHTHTHTHTLIRTAAAAETLPALFNFTEMNGI